MASRRMGRVAACMAPLLVAGAVAGAVAGQAGAASASTAGIPSRGPLFVSPDANPSDAGQSCGSATFTTIQSAVDAAGPGGVVMVCEGTYHEQVLISKPLALIGHHATIDETYVFPSGQLDVPNAGSQRIWAGVVILSSHVQVTGFTITNAQGEGILAMGGLNGEISHILISENAVVHNDQGFGVSDTVSALPGRGALPRIVDGQPYYLCQPPGSGDCGEGVHLTGVAYSTIRHNDVSDNAGGILLTDDTGPAHHNVVYGNRVSGNLTDCGITMPGHNPNALSATGQRQPSVAGVYANTIAHNVVTGNGVQGNGAGVLFANATGGTAAYNNLVENNYIAGNGLSGVTFHAHIIPPWKFEDLSGNRVLDNIIGTNNVNGDTLDFPGSPEDLVTTGILVFSGGTPVTVTIGGNHLSDNEIGIWLSQAVTAYLLPTNTFSNVPTPISANN